MTKETKEGRFNHVDIANKTDLGLPKTRKVFDILVEMLTEMKIGSKVAIPGLGVFTKKKTKARNGRNPKTGEAVKIEPKIKIAFRAASNLRTL